MGAKGDNCDGTLGFIEDNQSLLVGNKALYIERSPTIREEVIFEGLKVKGGNVVVKTSKEEANFVLSKEYTPK